MKFTVKQSEDAVLFSSINQWIFHCSRVWVYSVGGPGVCMGQWAMSWLWSGHSSTASSSAWRSSNCQHHWRRLWGQPLPCTYCWSV